MTGRSDTEERGPRPPIRLVTRLLAQLQTGILAHGIPALGGDLDRFSIFTLIVRQSLANRAGDFDAKPPAISAHSLAISNALVSAGLCRRTALGLIATHEGLGTPEFRDLLARTHDCFIRFVEDLTLLGMPMPQERGTAGYRPEISVESAADIMLSVADSNRGSHRDLAGLVIFSTVLCANVTNFAGDPVLARRHADDGNPVPDAMLVPVRARIVAQVLGLSETTVRRRVQEMLRDGRLERRRGGLIASEAWLNRPESIATSVVTYGNIRRILERVAAAGFPFSDPGRAYLTGRPEDIRF
jgi:hypothetical protein